MNRFFHLTRLGVWRLAFALLASAPALAAGDSFTPLKSDERVVLYPALAWSAGSNLWQAEIRGRVYEPERRGATTAALRQSLGLAGVTLSADEERIFAERARLFLVDHERGKRVFVRVGTNEFSLGKSRADGTFAGRIEFALASERRAPARREEVEVQASAWPPDRLQPGLPLAVILPPNDSRQFTGGIFPLTPDGVSIISDIDDTIKLTEVRDQRAVLRNTFLREFQPVPGMAEFYRRLALHPAPLVAADVSPLQLAAGNVRADSHRSPQSGEDSPDVAFHYISASPWQLYEPLADFVRAHDFPAGTFVLKDFRWKSRRFLSLFSDPVKYKLSVIEPLLKQFPRRKFILIGDSGESDPEIYGELARRFPAQIERIFIRDVTNESGDAARYARAFRGVSRERWQVFLNPAELCPQPQLNQIIRLPCL